MHALSSYDYALIRVVPSVERGECLNVGILLFCRTLRFLQVRIHLEEARVLALDPQIDLLTIREHLDSIVHICNGEKEAGPLGQMSQSERFHWLVSPRSTVIQTSSVHTGLCADPEATLEHLLKTMVYHT
nr:DUF3037 domain-containing protein [Ktedonobacteraceae bacterium]